MPSDGGARPASARDIDRDGAIAATGRLTIPLLLTSGPGGRLRRIPS